MMSMAMGNNETKPVKARLGAPVLGIVASIIGLGFAAYLVLVVGREDPEDRWLFEVMGLIPLVVLMICISEYRQRYRRALMDFGWQRLNKIYPVVEPLNINRLKSQVGGVYHGQEPEKLRDDDYAKTIGQLFINAVCREALKVSFKMELEDSVHRAVKAKGYFAQEDCRRALLEVLRTEAFSKPAAEARASGVHV